MTMNFFNQFAPVTLFGVSILIPAMVMPWLLYPWPSIRWLSNRILTVQKWLLATFIKQIFQPIKTNGHKWILMLTLIMVFIMTLNMLGLLPYTFTPTTQLSLNMAIAVPLWLGTVILGYRRDPTYTLSHLLPEGTPKSLIPILIIIETFSLMIRPLALGIRLTANLTAGHLLIQLISAAILFLSSVSFIGFLLTTILLFFLVLLETAVAMIQAYVFVLLLSLYLQENV